MGVLGLVVYLNVFLFVSCGYPPLGDDVQPGSVLLPASRRGRYLANIVRRQAVDGTGIKFNKDADRINAEAKKKVDVLSEELLPYIIAEQERRTTLYKRVMTAIQNGEKGVTVAEIRNKPPLIIRKGLMFRCPMNRAPKEPDGSGTIMCEDDIEPSPVMFDSCLSAEDRDLYVADNKYFFCNRHKVEGPDLPRNGSTIIGCAPMERTSLNYTSSKCALEDTDDVVVHYRYYPDRTYKFVTELDPDREVCDHWNPCQIGYIYSLPSPDQAVPANELWHDYTIPEDSIYEYVDNAHAGSVYTSIPRRFAIPPGFTYDSVWRVKDPYNSKAGPHQKVNEANVQKEISSDGQHMTITLKIKWSSSKYGPYFAIFTKEVNGKKVEKSIDFVHFEKALIRIVEVKELELMPGQRAEKVQVNYKCNKCELLRIMVRGDDFNVYNLESSRYRITESEDKQPVIQMDLDIVKPKDIGYFLAVFRDEENAEENIQFMIIRELQSTRVKESIQPGETVLKTTNYKCADCEVTDVMCNGDSVIPGGRVSIVKASLMISFSFPSFEDANSCVYMGVFKKGEKVYRKVLAVLDNASVTVTEPPPMTSPKEGDQFQADIAVSSDECSAEKVRVNGILLDNAPSRRTGTGRAAFFTATPTSVAIRISEFSAMYEGVYQAEFDCKGESITKTILEIRNPEEKVEEGGGAAPADGEATTAAGAGGDGAAAAEGEATTAAAGGDTPADAPAEGGDPPAEDAPPAERRKAAAKP